MMLDSSYPKFSLRKQTELLNINRSTFYYKPCLISKFDLDLMRRIDEIYLLYPFYGSRRIAALLNKELGININRKKIQRLMRLMGIEAIYQKKKRATTIFAKNHKTYPYLLKNLEINKPGQVWCADITYIPMQNGFMYLIAIIDWFSRYILTYRLSNSLEIYFCLDALDNALNCNHYQKPEIFNTDQGCQFTSNQWTESLKNNDIKISMDGKGRWIDNVIIERFFRSLKYEEIYLNPSNNVKDLKKQIQNYVYFYNNERLHQSLDYKTPKEIFFNKII